ncbi:hypothetical protein L208DRAFT_1382120 [Tricholoma matsutake]|nr:hypothetical protein L208DRAFT_1382120 [Tricholoma matsutake 945]
MATGRAGCIGAQTLGSDQSNFECPVCIGTKKTETKVIPYFLAGTGLRWMPKLAWPLLLLAVQLKNLDSLVLELVTLTMQSNYELEKENLHITTIDMQKGGEGVSSALTLQDLVKTYVGNAMLQEMGKLSAQARSYNTIHEICPGVVPWADITPKVHGGWRIMVMVSCGSSVRRRVHWEYITQLFTKQDVWETVHDALIAYPTTVTTNTVITIYRTGTQFHTCEVGMHRAERPLGYPFGKCGNSECPNARHVGGNQSG